VNPLLPGFGLIGSSAVLNAAFAVPLKLRRRFEWENTWLLAMFCAMIAFPLIAASFLLPHWLVAIASVGTSTLLTVAFFGFLWGIGSVTFAIGIDVIGISLGYAIIMGVVTVVGATIPMFRKWSHIPGDARTVILLGIGVCLAGVAVCGRAGVLRERRTNSASRALEVSSAAEKTAARAFLVGLAWCVFAGILSAGNNLGFDFAERVAVEAERLGAHPIFASLGRFIPVYWGGYLAVLIWCGSRALNKGTWRKFGGSDAPRDAGLAALMGLLHFLSQLTYGMGAYYVGRLGTTVGFAVMVATSLILANSFGFMTGEWKMATKHSKHVLYLGLAILITAVLVLAYGNSLVSGRG